MKKSNWTILTVLFVASLVYTYLWLVGGYHLTDFLVIDAGPLILWWIALVVVTALFVRSDRKHLVESRTVYVGSDQLFNPTKGLVAKTQAPLFEQVDGIVAGIKHSSKGQAFPEEDAFVPELVVRTTEFKAGQGTPVVWKGEVVEASKASQGASWAFNSPSELDTILQAW